MPTKDMENARVFIGSTPSDRLRVSLSIMGKNFFDITKVIARQAINVIKRYLNISQVLEVNEPATNPITWVGKTLP